MNRKMKNRRAFAAVTLSILLLTVCFTGAAFADTAQATKTATVPVEFNIKAPQLSFTITEKITATNNGKTSVITYSSLEVENSGEVNITVDKLTFDPIPDENDPTAANRLIADTGNDFANMDADSNYFSLVAKCGDASHDFGGSDALEYTLNKQVAKKTGKLTVEFEGHTAPYTQDFSGELGSFVVTVSK